LAVGKCGSVGRLLCLLTRYTFCYDCRRPRKALFTVFHNLAVGYVDTLSQIVYNLS